MTVEAWRLKEARRAADLLRAAAGWVSIAVDDAAAVDRWSDRDTELLRRSLSLAEEAIDAVRRFG